MPSHTFQIIRSGASVYDFQSGSVNYLSAYSPAPYDPKVKTVQDTVTMNPTGSSVTTFYDNLNTLFRLIDDAEFNYRQWQRGLSYTPIFIQFKDVRSTTPLQTELLGGSYAAIDNWMTGALRANIVPDLKLTLIRRPYWEESAAQSLLASIATPNGGSGQVISGIRGDVPSPLKITVASDIGNQDRIIVAFKSNGTVANFAPVYEAESFTLKNTSDYLANGTHVASLSDANFSGSGMRWTPGGTAEESLLVWNISSNVIDQMGTYRVYVRCRESASSTYSVKIRVRSGIYNSTTGSYQWGDYGDYAKYLDGTGTSGSSNSSSGGTTAIGLVDCGVITLPPIDTQGVAPTAMALELRGQSTASGSGHNFDIDSLYLMPCYEMPENRGLQVVTFPYVIGTGANPVGIVDSNDRQPNAYLDVSGVPAYPAADIRGNKILAWTNRSIRIFVLTERSDILRHNQASTPSIAVTCTPRYKFPGRGS